MLFRISGQFKSSLQLMKLEGSAELDLLKIDALFGHPAVIASSDEIIDGGSNGGGVGIIKILQDWSRRTSHRSKSQPTHQHWPDLL